VQDAKRRTSRLSAGGRLRCGDAGAVNLQRWKDSQPEALDHKAAVERFEADLSAEIGRDLSASRRALLLSAATSYATIRLAHRKLVATHRLRREVRSTADMAVRAQMALLRALKGLGVELHGADDPREEETLENVLAEYAEETEEANE